MYTQETVGKEQTTAVGHHWLCPWWTIKHFPFKKYTCESRQTLIIVLAIYLLTLVDGTKKLSQNID